ncbi:lipopolysaccharide biosynthesis protein [Spirosoma sp. BT702]|uniref:Lipopolysaccharide biosynthesis protein n=1 Tax=Spirosoma profusum TaxID=2771354 RepID=A0A927ASR3_9BACT|nr:lipopolysaccharide biosynthesis protein [Spirosoma profusum]MBD2704306.1 lipopolysaccharide biosynthesis protein [Spirosoma profusum]
MTIEVFFRLLKQHLLWFILLPIVAAAAAFFATRNEPKVYKSQATLYTGLVSGYSLLSDKQSMFNDRSASAIDNILTTLSSRETVLQIGIGLLTDHMRLRQPDTLVLGPKGYQELHQAITGGWENLFFIAADSSLLRHTIDSLAKVPNDNPVKALLLTSNSYYSVQNLAEDIKATPRKNTNDILLMEYEADDPAVAQSTLRYAIEILNKRYSTLKTSETNSVIGYYESKLEKAKNKLAQAEESLRAFSTEHQVLDYDEEARNMASARESMGREYNQELLRKDAAKAALDALSKRSGQQSTVRMANNDLNEKQKKLTEAENKLANARAYGQPKQTIAQLQAAVNQASEELKISAQKYDAVANTSDAVPNQTVANDKLNKSLEFEESSARLELYKKQMDDYQAKADQYGPLGTRLRQLKRDQEIAEKEYLDLLNNVEQSRTRRQDVSIGGTLEILDAPDFPLLPKPSKRFQMIAIGFGVGIFIALLLTALRFWLDKRINSPEQAETMIGMPVTALFPTVRKPMVFTKATRAARSMFEQLFNAINIEVTQNTTKPYPPIITLFSIRSKQGKSWVSNGLIELYEKADQQVAYCYPRVTGKEQMERRHGVTLFPYTVRPDFMNVTGIDYLIDYSHGFEVSQFDRIILEIPALINNQIPVYLLKSSALSLFVIDANSPWARAEKQLLSMYVRVTNQPILTVLNRVEGNYVDVPRRADAMPTATQQERTLQSQRNVIE